MERSFARVLLVPLAVAVGIFLIIHYNLHAFFMDREALAEFLSSWGATSVLVFIVLQILQVVVSPLPGDVTGLIGGYLYGPALGVIYSTIGLTLGSWLAFVLARTYGLPFVERIIRPATIRKYDYFLEHKGRAIAFLFFLIPGFPKDSLCYILGLSHMKTRDFLVISTSGRLLGTVILTLQGSSLREQQDVLFFVLLGLTALIIVGGYFHVWWWLRALIRERRRSRLALPPPEPAQGVTKVAERRAEGKKG